MFDLCPVKFENEPAVLAKSIEYCDPDKTSSWQKAGIDFVMGRRESYCIYDKDGRRLIDLHLHGCTCDLGHRNTELVETLKGALDYFDMGNRGFPSVARAVLAEALVKVSPGMKYAIFGAGDGEAVDIALKSARYVTKRRKIVSILKGYHGHGGLSVTTGDERFSKIFLSDQPKTFAQVPFNDVVAMEQALKGRDVAALLMETIPATYGFPMPDAGYLAACTALCETYGAMYIADEVQTGMMRCGQMWGWQTYDIQPDIMVTGNGLGGGLYPISACLVNEKASGWLHEDGAAHTSTSGGAELGCVVAHKVLEILQRHGDLFTGIRHRDIVLGLEFGPPEAAVAVSRTLDENGVWAIFSSLDNRVLQWTPGTLLSSELCQEIMDRFAAAMPRAKAFLAQN